MSRSRAAVVLAVALASAYAADVGHGFIKDDFRWVRETRLASAAELPRLFSRTDGFYRPLVSVSFALVSGVAGPSPRAHGLANLALLFAAAALVWALGRRLGLPPSAALAAAGAWAFNFHGINMAIAWMSGRTSLLGTLFSVLAAIALWRNRSIAAGAFAFAAFLSKEEVVALPLIFTIWLMIDRRSLRAAIAPWIALGVYFVLRGLSGAVGITDAPPYYQFTFDPVQVATNIIEYADRSMTLGTLMLIAASLALRRLPAATTTEWRVISMGAVWLVCGFAATIWLPVRSSLYAVFPSVGFALVVSCLLTAMVRIAEPRQAWRVAMAGLVLPFLLLPVYWQRNVRWTELRSLSTATIRAIQAGALPRETLVVLEDDLSHRANFRHVFGALLHEAAALHFDNRLALWIEPPPPELDSSARPVNSAHTVTFRLIGGRVTPAPLGAN
jgi:hypothetical protein